MTLPQDHDAPAYWWVNQSQTYVAEHANGILWAPKRAANGRSLAHWDSMLAVMPGDRVIHYANGAIRALGTVAAAAVDSRRPTAIPRQWDEDGRMVRVHSTELETPITKDQIDQIWRATVPFARNGNVQQIYLTQLRDDFASYLMATFAELRAAARPFAARYVPAEARADAAELLASLVGETITTITGQANTVLQLDGTNVLVATGRSPGGQPVPVKELQEALDKLADDGQLTITPAEVGYRSAFIGAVLLALPGARAVGSPPVITFDPVPEPAEELTPGQPFAGDLHKDVTVKARGEQVSLRRTLLGTADFASCAICGHSYPVRFLWASHIKKRAACTEEEARDLSHVAMLACLLGCDALFEAGLIAVNDDGRVVASPTVVSGTRLDNQIQELEGRPVTAFTPDSAGYFAWHRANTFHTG